MRAAGAVRTADVGVLTRLCLTRSGAYSSSGQDGVKPACAAGDPISGPVSPSRTLP